MIILAEGDRHQSNVSSKWKSGNGNLLVNSSVLVKWDVLKDAYVKPNDYIFPQPRPPPRPTQPSNISHLHIHYFSIPLVQSSSCHHFPSIYFKKREKKPSAALSSPLTQFFPLWHLLSESRLVCFSAGPDLEPVGWSLITIEWAANGRLRCSPTQQPPPHTPLPVLGLHGDL